MDRTLPHQASSVRQKSMSKILKRPLNRFILVAIVANLGFSLSVAESHNCSDDHLKVLVNSSKKGFVCRRCDKFGTCPPGQGWPVSCNSTITDDTVIECKNCIQGKSYSPKDDRTQCRPCRSTTCLPHEKVTGNCTREDDTTACTGVCEDDFCMNSNKTICQSCSVLKSEKNRTIVKKPNGDGIPNKDSTVQRVVGITVPLIAIIGFCLLCKCCPQYRQSIGCGCCLQNSGTLSVNDVENQSKCDIPQGSSDNGEEIKELSSSSTTCDDCLDVTTPLMQNNNGGDEPDREQADRFPGTSPSLSGRSRPSIESMEMAQGFPDTTSKSAKIGALNAETYLEVCRILNQALQGKDWRTMAGKMGYNIDKVKSFSKNDDPADAVLEDWRTVDRNDLYKLIEILTDMGRDDVVGIIKETPGVSTSPNN